jgi:hypothetical protein
MSAAARWAPFFSSRLSGSQCFIGYSSGLNELSISIPSGNNRQIFRDRCRANKTSSPIQKAVDG